MGVKHNNQIVNSHFHKKWQTRVKCWFNQPARHDRRRQRRIEKARKVAPQPTTKLRPIIRCPTLKYNMRRRLGRGFTPDEMKAAGISMHFAKSVGIAIDRRRRNRSVEGLQVNVQRLKEYCSKLILFPRNPAKPGKSDSSPEEIKMATQHTGTIMPIKDTYVPDEPRAITEKERKVRVYTVMRYARKDARLVGIRAKKAKENAEASQQAVKPKKKN